jgi:rubrerythrin
LIAEGLRHGAAITLELAEETARPEEIVSNFTDELNENNPVVLAGADESYTCLEHETGDVLEAAIVARRGSFIFRLTIPANSRAREQLAFLARLILQRYALDAVATMAAPHIVCRYCGRPFTPTANSTDCPYCGAANGTGAPTLGNIGGHDSIRLGSVGQMAQSLVLDDLLSVGLTPALKQPRVYDDPDAVSAIRVFEVHPWDGSTRIGFGIYDSAAHRNNRLDMVVRGLSGRSEPTALTGSETAFVVHGKHTMSICAERGDLVFSITVPGSPAATTQLLRLAALILQRVAGESRGAQREPRVA